MRLPDAMRSIHRFLATLLVLCFAIGPLPLTPAARAANNGMLRGILYESDGDTRLPAARAIAINVTTGERFESNLTGSNGAYEIKGMPEGTYDVVIESGGRLFVVENLIDLKDGQSITISFSVDPRAPSMRRIEGLIDPAGTAFPIGKELGAPGAAGGGSIMKSPGGIISLVVLTIGAAIVLDSALDDDKPASPVVP